MVGNHEVHAVQWSFILPDKSWWISRQMQQFLLQRLVYFPASFSLMAMSGLVCRKVIVFLESILMSPEVIWSPFTARQPLVSKRVTPTGLFFSLSAHLVAEVKVIAHRVRNFHTLENKYDLTLCQSRLHTASEIFIRHKKNWIGSIFSVFRIRSKHFERCFDSSEPPYKQTAKSRMAISLKHFRVSGFRIGACRVNVFPVTTAAVLNKNEFEKSKSFFTN